MANVTPTFVKSTDDATAITHTVTAVTIPAGKLAILRFGYQSDTVTITSVADDAGNTWSVAISGHSSSGDTQTAAIAYLVVPAAGLSGATITITLSATATLASDLTYFTSDTGWLPQATVLDKTSFFNTGLVTSWTSNATATTTQADELLVGCMYDGGAINGGTSSPTGAWAEETEYALTHGYRLVTQWQHVTSTGAYANTGNWTAAEIAACAIATFKTAAPAVATGPTPPLPRAFQEQGRIYSGERTAFQPLAFEVPDPTRAFQEGTRLGEPRAFQDQAFQVPDPSVAFQPEGFDNVDDSAVFQMSVMAFQDATGYQGDAFQEFYRQATGAYTITAAGAITSAEAFGQADRVVRIEAPVAIASSEAFGTTHVQFVVRNLGAITSAEAFGQATRVQRIVKQAGAITSAEAFGTAKLIRIVGPSGIASAEALGTPKLVTSIIKAAGGIASAEAFGVTRVRFVVAPVAIGSAEAFGTTRVLSPQYISAAGAIPSAQAFGTTHVLFVVKPIGITSAEAFGTPKLLTSIVKGVGAIASAESFGQATHVRFVVGTIGIVSSEAFGRPTLTSGVYFITAVGAISSAEAFGLTHVLFVVRGIGITSAQAFGTAQLPRLLRLTSGISSAEAFGPSTKIRRLVGTLGIASREAFGTPTKSPQVLFVQGIGSTEAWGRPTVFDATIQTASGYGKVFLSDVAMFRLVVMDGTAFGPAISDVQMFRETIDDAKRFDGRPSDALAFAGSLDDTPGG